MKEETLNQVKNVFKIEKECIELIENNFDFNEFEKAIKIIKNAKLVGTSGCGHSGIMSRHLSHLLCCIEKPSKFIDPSEAVHGGMGFLNEGDVMIFSSRGGKTKELLPICDICKSKNIKVITITENTESPLALNADVVIKQHVNRETDKYNSQGTTSSLSLIVLYHLIQTALIEELNYSNDQFKVIHPGGAVGERLNKGENK